MLGNAPPDERERSIFYKKNEHDGLNEKCMPCYHAKSAKKCHMAVMGLRCIT
jgi:hypothetical protein